MTCSFAWEGPSGPAGEHAAGAAHECGEPKEHRRKDCICGVCGIYATPSAVKRVVHSK